MVMFFVERKIVSSKVGTPSELLLKGVSGGLCYIYHLEGSVYCDDGGDEDGGVDRGV